jgi:TonB family protein
MSKKTPAKHDPTRPLPERANLEHLRKEAKQRLKAMRLDNPGVTLSAVQLTVAREYGFSSWRSLIAYVKSQSDKESQLDDQHEVRKPATILYKVMPTYTEIARLNRLEGAVVVSAYFTAEGSIAGIRVARGLPDGMTWRAILAMRMVRFTPASLNGAPVRTREFIEFNFNLH